MKPKVDLITKKTRQGFTLTKVLRRTEGFTLIELLVVIAILGVLAVVGLATFRTSQMKGRDAQRKSDLKQIASALEILYNDYEQYPASSNGSIKGCSYNAASPGASGTCAWGTGAFTDGDTVYIKSLPKDPAGNFSYYYRSVTVGGVANQGFQLYAQLENTQDASPCIGDDCGAHSDLPAGVTCGTSATCNFSITSPNVTPTDGDS